MTKPDPTPAVAELKPCHVCGADCRVEFFPADERRTDSHVWICSNDAVFGGDCPNAKGYLSAGAWNQRPDPQPQPQVEGDAGITREALVRAMYDAWPHTVTSQALADLTGLPMNSVLSFDVAEKAGASFSGLERYAGGALALLAARSPNPDAIAGLVDETEFLLDRLDELERDLLDDEVGRDFHGHISHPMARLRDMFATFHKGADQL